MASLSREAEKPGTEWFPATMPAQVQEVLLQRGDIPDPRQSRNCAETTWVFNHDWVYATRFVTPAAVNGGPVWLRCDGLDTLATLYLNGQEVGQAANMFRRHAFEVGKQMAPVGETNTLLIRFHSPARFLEQVRARSGNIDGRVSKPFKHLRKSGSDFSSYLGAKPNYLKMGLFRDVMLDIPGRAWLDDVWVRTELNEDLSEARLVIQPTVSGSADRMRWVLRGPEGGVVSEGTGAPVPMTLDVPQPKLWWPHTHGTPHLYTLRVELMADGQVQDARDVAIGIRKIEPVLKDPATGEPRFAFKVNGQRIFLRGICWAPLEMTTHVWNRDRANELLDLVVQGHMNVLRVWGEGALPPEHFYDECNRRGILVWQEFMTGNGMDFPLDDPAYRGNLTAEIVDEIQRLRNHPSVFLWCGGNEHYLGFPSENPTNPKSPAGRELFQGIMPALVKEHDPTRYYHPSSPWGGTSVNWPNGNYPLEGDWHDYNTIRFQPQASVPLFAAEVCMVSPPLLSSMKRYLTDDEIWPPGFVFRVDEPGEIAWPPEWEYHTTGSGLGENRPHPRLLRTQQRRRPDPRPRHGARRILAGGKRAVPPRHTRRDGRRKSPMLGHDAVATERSVADDVHERGGLLQRAKDRLLLSATGILPRARELGKDCRPQLRLVGERRTGADLRQVARAASGFRGKGACRKILPGPVAPGQSRRVSDTDSLGEIVRRSELLAATFHDQTAICLLAPERFLKLSRYRPTLKVLRVADGIQISTDNFARQVTLEMAGGSGAVFEDNYFDLLPGASRTVRLLHATEGSKIRVSAVSAEPVEVEIP